MPYTMAARNMMLNVLAPALAYASLHYGVPPTNELESYERVAVRFDEAFSGVIRLQERINVNVPEGAKITHVGFWTASQGGVLLAYSPVSEIEYQGPGVYTIESAALDLNVVP